MKKGEGRERRGGEREEGRERKGEERREEEEKSLGVQQTLTAVES